MPLWKGGSRLSARGRLRHGTAAQRADSAVMTRTDAEHEPIRTATLRLMTPPGRVAPRP